MPAVTAPAFVRESAAHPHQLHLQTSILNDVNTRAGESLGGFVVSYPQLHPHGARPFRDDVVDVWWHVFWSPEHVHDVDVTGDVDETAINSLAEDFGDVGIVDGNRHNVVARLLRVCRDEMGRLVRSRLGLDTKDRYSMAGAEQCANLVGRIEKARSPLGGGCRGHGFERCEYRARACGLSG